MSRMAELAAEQEQQMQQQQEDEQAYLWHCMTELRPHLPAELFKQVQQALGF